jgi:hypothetical protein
LRAWSHKPVRVWTRVADGLLSNQKSKFGSILEGLWMVNVGIFYDHLEYFIAIWYNLWPFGVISGHLLHFSQFGMFWPRKIWQPWFELCVLYTFAGYWVSGFLRVTDKPRVRKSSHSRRFPVLGARLPDGLFSNQKIPILVNFGGPWNGKCYNIVWPLGTFYGHLVQFMSFGYGLWSFGIFFTFWDVWTKKNLATLLGGNVALSFRPGCRGVVAIVYANGTEYRGFESRQGWRNFLGVHTL